MSISLRSALGILSQSGKFTQQTAEKMIADLKQQPPGYFNMEEVYEYVGNLPEPPKTELTPDGEQYVIPGAEKVEREQTNVQGSLWG